MPSNQIDFITRKGPENDFLETGDEYFIFQVLVLVFWARKSPSEANILCDKRNNRESTKLPTETPTVPCNCIINSIVTTVLYTSINSSYYLSTLNINLHVQQTRIGNGMDQGT